MNLAVYGNGLGCNDVIKDVDCVIKRDVYPQNVHLCTKISMGYQFLF